MRARHGFVITTLLMVLTVGTANADEFVSAFPKDVVRPWAGPEFWTNPMEDWQISGGRLEVIRSGGNRNVHVLTRYVRAEQGTLSMSVVLGRVDGGKSPRSVGFRVGIKSELGDYRSALFFGRGLDAGIATDGSLFIGTPPKRANKANVGDAERVELHLAAEPAGDKYSVTLTAFEPGKDTKIAEVKKQVAGMQLVGSLALVNQYTPKAPAATPRAAGKGPRHWFGDWRISGTKVVTNEERTFGPILWAMHTLSRGALRMTAQMPPLAHSDTRTVRLETMKDGKWKTIASDRIDQLACTATFRIDNWDAENDVPYRIRYALKTAGGKIEEQFYTGTVRRDPVDRDLVVAAFTGNTDRGFPNAHIVQNVTKHNPDVMFFTGDQIYEQVSGYGIHRGPVKLATLNYLRKWYMLGWAFGDLMRDRVTLCLPDDHDVYQGNIWGNGGNPTTMRDHAKGGYAMPAEWVNMIQRTQTSHHPKPFDPTPIDQSISVYYGDMLYGRVSFAIVEDRKFKSGPQGNVNYWKGRPDHVKDRNFDPKSVDPKGLTLLGERQLKFLDEWTKDWRGADMKSLVSQTIFCNLANYHGGNREFLVADLDANGWPQTGRARALQAIRKGFAFHIAGDQHLPSIVHHGLDAHGDCGFSFCVPSIAAGYPRSWRADEEGRPVKNRMNSKLANTGDYFDGLGNRMSVYAIGNPERKNRPGTLKTLHDKSSGYGIVRFDKQKRDITIECWKLLVDVDKRQATDQFPGWPKTVNAIENYGRKAVDLLPTLQVIGMTNPVVQVIDEANGKTVYTLRIRGDSFQPKVFRAGGSYTVKVGEQQPMKMQTFKNVKPDKDGVLKVAF
jgi:hypothetical protein